MPLTLKNFYRSGWTPNPSRTIFYYDFENSNNRLADASGNSNDITGSSNVQYVQQNGQTYAETTSQSSGFDIPSSYGASIGTGDFTMSCWCYPTTGSGYYFPQIFSLNYDGSTDGVSIIWFDVLNVLGGGEGIKYQFGEAAYRLGTSAVALLGGWHHFVATRNSGVLSCYVDGVLDYQATNNFSFALTGNGCCLGRRASSIQTFNSGAKGDKFILEKVGWSVTDVTKYYNQTKSLYGIQTLNNSLNNSLSNTLNQTLTQTVTPNSGSGDILTI